MLKSAKFKVFSPGKTIIIGEHAVIYGSYAIAMPLKNFGVQIAASVKFAGDSFHIEIEKPINPTASHYISSVLLDACEILESKPFHLKAKIDSQIPIGAGLGSSASLCVSALKLVAEINNYELSHNDLAKKANLLEERFHGKPSGLDTMAVASPHPILFKRGQEPKPIHITQPSNGNWHFLLIDSLKRESTKTMIQVSASYFKKNQPQLTEQFDNLALQIVDGLSAGQPDAVGKSMNEANQLLAQSGVVSSALEELIDRLRPVEFLGLKITGAGGGGCLLGLLHPEFADQQVEKLHNLISPERIYDLEDCH